MIEISNKNSIDSCEIFIPLEHRNSKVVELPKELNTNIKSIRLDNGQIIYTDDIYNNIIKLNKLDLRSPQVKSIKTSNKDNIKLNGLEVYISTNNLTNINYLHIQTPAKLLGKDYFEGINSRTIDTIFDIIKDSNIKFNVSNDSIKEIAKFRDVDIKRDFTGIEPAQFILLIKDLHKYTKHSQRTDIGSKPYLQNDNLGIDFGRRETSKVASPHNVIYHKTIEMLNKSIDFKNQYFSTSTLPQIARIETNFKNSQLWSRIGSKNTIVEILDTLDNKQYEINQIVLECLTKHLTIDDDEDEDVKQSNENNKYRFIMNIENTYLKYIIHNLYHSNRVNNYKQVQDEIKALLIYENTFNENTFKKKKRNIKYLCNIIENDMKITHNPKTFKNIENELKIKTINDIFLRHNINI